MLKWIPGQGFHLVQSTGPIDHEANQKRMDLLEERLQAAEKTIGGDEIIGQKVKLSRESKEQALIHQLSILGIHQGNKGEQLQSLDYYSLRSLLAVRLAVRT